MKKLLIMTLAALGALCTTSCGSSSAEKESSAPFTADTVLTAAEKEARVFTPEIMLKMGRLGTSQLSPAGDKVMYTVSYYSVAQNKAFTALWVMDANGENNRQITDYSYSIGEPRWSAKGDKIYFTSSVSGQSQIHSIAPDGSNFKQLSAFRDGVVYFGISPDETKVWYTRDVPVNKIESAEIFDDLKESQARIYDELMCRHWDVWEDGKYSHIFIAEVENERIGSGMDIMYGEPYDAPGAPYFDSGEISWTPDSKSVAYTCRKLTGYEYAISTNTDIYLYNVAQKTTKNLTEGMVGYDKYPRFSPDGKYMAWQSMARPGNESDKERLFILNLENGEKEYLNEGFDYNATSLVWADDSKSIYFICPIEATHQVCEVEVSTKAIRQITRGDHDYVALSVVGDKMLGNLTTISRASELFDVNIESGEQRQITAINQHIYDNVDMGEVEKRWVTTTDGKKMLTWVIMPPKAVKDGSVKYPTLLYCQGGPQSVVSQFWSYRWNFQLIASGGYVVVAPNRRGLPSFGQEWLDQISGDYSGQNIDDYLSAIDDVATESYVDKDRLGCVGASYGGYSVYYLAGKHEGRFKAFISHCGIFDFTSMYGSTEELWFVNNDYGGAYWDKDNAVAQRSYANSPHHFVQNWDTPILIITGEMDYRIPYTQSLEAFTAAQALGVPSRLVVFKNEAHQVFGAQNAIVWNREFFGWLNKYL